ncbi:MAG TPA: SIMPL domain-containing protein [Planctomycetota bacterium]|nr:SIMPL domain-containing protein [Planctomycetota bacterium]
MATEIRANLFNVALVVSISAASALIICTTVVANTYKARLENPKRMEQSLAVTGSARKRIRSDLGVWSIHVCGKGDDTKTAYADMKKSMDRVQKFLSDRGFSPAEISLGAIASHSVFRRDRFGNVTMDVTGYKLSRACTVSSPQVDKVLSAAAEVTELIQEELDVQSGTPEFYYTKIGDLKIEMIGEASRDARMRADQIVEHAGCSIGEVRNARMGVLQITRPESTEVSASGIYDTSTIDKDVNAVVSLTFGIQNR